MLCRVVSKFYLIGPTFFFPVKTVTFYWVESLVTSSILKMRKSHKKLALVYAYPHAQIHDRGGWLGPPTLNRVKKEIKCMTRLFMPCQFKILFVSFAKVSLIFSGNWYSSVLYILCIIENRCSDLCQLTFVTSFRYFRWICDFTFSNSFTRTPAIVWKKWRK